VQWTDNPERYRIHFASAILSHELAHQYWGHVVGWSAAEDQWFSEALAEYSSHLYTSHYYGADDYEARLKGWRRFARENAEYGPVAIHGGRLGDGRYGLWYCKGPYALHVLRHWIGDEAFIELLRTTCEAAPHRNVSTDDLRQLWEKRLGQDLGWFFDAWLHNPVLPDLEVRFTGGTPEDGMPRVTLTQVQDGPPVRLRVPLKLTVRKGAKGTATEWRTVSFDTAEYTAPLEDLPGALIDVEVDPQQTTLWARDPRPAREED